MTIGFFNVYRGDPIHLVLADLMIRSVRETMPGVPIVQFTDEDSPVAYGVDEVRRLQNVPRDVIRTQHYLGCKGEWLFVDTDIIFQQDVRDVFYSHGWDIAVCDRQHCMVDGEEDLEFIKETPFNFGVIFSRSPAYWKAVAESLSKMTPQRQDWMGTQFAGCKVIADRIFPIHILPGTIYNYPPRNLADECKEAAIVHYKGAQRKQMMLERLMKVVV